MKWIPKNNNCSYCYSFQKMIYRLYKVYDLDKEWFDKVLEYHFKVYDVVFLGGLDKENYFGYCWKLVDKIKHRMKQDGKWPETKQDISNLYGFLVNRKREENIQ